MIVNARPLILMAYAKTAYHRLDPSEEVSLISEESAFYPGKVLVRTSFAGTRRGRRNSPCMQVAMLGSRQETHEFDEFTRPTRWQESDDMDWEDILAYWN